MPNSLIHTLLLVPLLIATFVSQSAAAPRWKFDPMINDERIDGAEVCFSRGREAGPVQERLVSGPEVRCLPADSILALPAGSWRLFVRSEARSLVGTHPFTIVSSSDSSDHDVVETLKCPMTVAAKIDVRATRGSLTPGEQMSVYVANKSNDSPPMLMPVPPTVPTALVPASTDLRMVVTRDDRIAKVGPLFRVEPNTNVSAPQFTQPTAIVIPIGIKQRLREALSLPTVLLVNRATRRVVVRVPLQPNLSLGLLVFDELSAGTYDVQIEEPSWSGSAVQFKVPADRSTVLVTPDLVFAPAKVTRIDWSIDPGLFGWMQRGSTTCIGPEAPTPGTLRLLSCEESASRPIPALLARCAVLRNLELPDDVRGRVEWPTEGATWLELSFAGIRKLQRVGEVLPGGVLPIDVAARHLFGKVTRGGDPVEAQLDCATAPTKSDPSSGAYDCWAQERSGELVITVERCGVAGEPYRHRIDPEADTSRPIDIELPDNELQVLVKHAKTGVPIKGAKVVAWPGTSDNEGAAGTRLLPESDAEGSTKTDTLQPDSPWVVCAFKQARACKEDVRPSATGRTVVELELEPKVVNSTRVVAATPIVDGTISVIAGGRELHIASVAQDGSVELPGVAGAVSYVLSSGSHPLCVLVPDRSNPEVLLLRVPYTQPRSFVVRARESGPVTVMLGSDLVPVTAFLRHQSLFKEQYFVTPQQPLRVVSVDGSRGVMVLLGRAAVGIADPFVNPGYLAAMPKLPLTSAGEVSFP
jgi:hypothetical protein